MLRLALLRALTSNAQTPTRPTGVIDLPIRCQMKQFWSSFKGLLNYFSRWYLDCQNYWGYCCQPLALAEYDFVTDEKRLAFPVDPSPTDQAASEQ